MLFYMLMVIIFLFAFMRGKEGGAPLIGLSVGLACAFLFDFGVRLIMKSVTVIQRKISQRPITNKRFRSVMVGIIDWYMFFLIIAWLIFMCWGAEHVTGLFSG